MQKPFIDFLCIGAQKAGTTWLYENLREHPEIGMPTVKELHFWDKNYRNGLDWYKGYFDKLEGKVKGEITPAYAILPLEKIKEIYNLNSDLKLIYIIRNPIERAWSSALMALKRAEMRFEEASEQWFIDHFNSEGSKKRGDYETCIQNWTEFFSKKQMLVLDYKEIQNDPINLLIKCCKHLKVSTEFFTHQKNLQNNKIYQKIFSSNTDKRKIPDTLMNYLKKLYDNHKV